MLRAGVNASFDNWYLMLYQLGSFLVTELLTKEAEVPAFQPASLSVNRCPWVCFSYIMIYCDFYAYVKHFMKTFLYIICSLLGHKGKE